MTTEDRIRAAAQCHGREIVSDNDRERVVQMLKTAFVQGRLPRPPAHAVVKAVAGALVALAAVAIAGMTGAWAAPAPPTPPNMSMKACYVFYDWIGARIDQERGTPGMRVGPTLNRAVNDAREGANPAIAADLPKLQRAYRRYERLSVPPLSPASRHSAANHLNADTNQVVSVCQARGRQAGHHREP